MKTPKRSRIGRRTPKLLVKALFSYTLFPRADAFKPSFLFSLAFVRNSGRGLFFLLFGRAVLPALYIGREGGRTKARAEPEAATDGLRAFGRPHFLLCLYIRRTKPLYIGRTKVLTLLLYIGEGGGGVHLKIFFNSSADSSIWALRRPPFVI